MSPALEDHPRRRHLGISCAKLHSYSAAAGARTESSPPIASSASEEIVVIEIKNGSINVKSGTINVKNDFTTQPPKTARVSIVALLLDRVLAQKSPMIFHRNLYSNFCNLIASQLGGQNLLCLNVPPVPQPKLDPMDQ